MASAFALTGIAYADTPPEEATTTPSSAESASDRVVYEAAFFARFNPQTALDMVRQTPGFSLDGGDDRRGFSGAVGNLLIDGVRPSTKSQSLSGILSRIPADQVVRIELLRGSEIAGDASGQSVLLNIVRTETAGGGVWEVGFERTSRGVFAPRGELSYSGRHGLVEWGLGGSVFSQFRDLPGWRRFYDANGDYTGRAETPSPRDFREIGVTGNIAFPLAGGRLSANAQVNWWRFHADSDYLFFDENDDPDFSLFTVFEERQPGAELGLNYDRDFGSWSLSLIGLINRERYESEEDGQFEDGLGATQSVYSQEITQERGETIARASLTRVLGPRQRLEFGGEGAFNSLDQTLSFVEDGVAASIPNSNVLIEEERAEFFAVHSWRPADAWAIETRVAWETSTLTFTGDDNQVVDLAFWKPSIQFTRTFAGNNQVRLRIYRDVGQLDFGDFVSAAGVADDLINGGNTDLTPQSDLRIELGGDFRFPGGAALGITLTRHDYEDVADLVTLVDDRGTPDPSDDIIFDAPGNIGDAEAWSLEVNASAPVPFVPGGRVTIEGALWDTEVVDPLTGSDRIFSYTPESELSVSFRQDLTAHRFAWGVEIYKQGEVQAYRYNEVDTSEEGPWIDIFAETTALPNGMKLRVWAANAFDGEITRERRFFDPDRNGSLSRYELRQRHFAEAPWFIVELSGRF
jgi:hypothetical protein